MSEDQARALLQQMQTLEGYMEELTQREEYVTKLIQEASSSIESIKALKEKDEHETLVPIGLGAYVRAKIDTNEKLVLNIGAGAAMERDKDSTINYLESRIKELELSQQQISSQKQQVNSQLEKGRSELNKLTQSQKSPSA